MLYLLRSIGSCAWPMEFGDRVLFYCNLCYNLTTFTFVLANIVCYHFALPMLASHETEPGQNDTDDMDEISF